ncbi:phosphotransacetylase [Vagococcus sp. BWB3-3]|uniref:Phosphotransacetylase n=1 Tax=Vagococcus allomyrinae TaxID=2794353 RepID=A0A940PBT6_9ENTE|nr:phosphate acyltransferase [Vagococcus allomyrinae]MBP1040581.1 phosphotransacetylase [Vagococcus allomyrinae]
MKVTVVIAGADQKMVAEVVVPLLLENRYQFVLVSCEALSLPETRVKLEQVKTMGEVAERAVEVVIRSPKSILLKGQIQTAVLLRAVLTNSELSHQRLISQVTKIELIESRRQFLLTDPALNIEPNTRAKIDLCLNALEVANKLGMRKPKLALLSSVEVLNPKIPSAVSAAEVVDYFKQTPNEAIIEGPLSMDVATDPTAAKSKGYSGQIQGDAQILVAPNIDSANILYKTLAHFTDCQVSGVLVGTSVPIALTSRSDSPLAKIAAVKFAESMID